MLQFYLQHLVRRNMSLEILRVPKFPDELPKPGNQKKALVPWRSHDTLVIVLIQEVIPKYFGVKHAQTYYAHLNPST